VREKSFHKSRPKKGLDDLDYDPDAYDKIIEQEKL